jgi:hypothetical protein
MKELAKNQQFRVAWISYLKVPEVFFLQKVQNFEEKW